MKKTVVYTRVNGALHIENCKNYKKVLLLNSTLTLIGDVPVGNHLFVIFAAFFPCVMRR